MKKIHFEGRTYEGMMTSYENLKDRYVVVHLLLQLKIRGAWCGCFEVSKVAKRRPRQMVCNVPTHTVLVNH